MGLFVLQIVNGITNGMLYGLAALGLAMVYKSLGYLNFAHSDTIMLGAILYTILIKISSVLSDIFTIIYNWYLKGLI